MAAPPAALAHARLHHTCLWVRGSKGGPLCACMHVVAELRCATKGCLPTSHLPWSAFQCAGMTQRSAASGCPPRATMPGQHRLGRLQPTTLPTAFTLGIFDEPCLFCCTWKACPQPGSSVVHRSFVARWGVMFETARGPEAQYRWAQSYQHAPSNQMLSRVASGSRLCCC